MNSSYQEKSILGSLLAVGVIYGYYFAQALRHVGQEEFGGASLGRLIFTVVALIIVEIIYQVTLAVALKPERKDERDILIEGKAYRNAYLLLSAGAVAVITCGIIAGVLRDAAGAQFVVLPFLRVLGSPYLLINLFLLAMVSAELLKFFTQLFYYRRGLR